MRKFLLFAVVTLLFFLNTKTASAFSGSGGGVLGNPYQITTCDQLQEMSSELGAYYKIMNSFDCSATTGWNAGAGFLPVGATAGSPFTGNLDGGGFNIDALFIHKGTDGIGLFGYTSGATITNLNLTNIEYEQPDGVQNVFQVGGITGNMNGGTLSGSSTSGNIKQTDASWTMHRVGGLVGTAFGASVISNDSTTVAISVAGELETGGGLVGYTYGTTSITDSSSAGSISAGLFSNPIGGLIGAMAGNSTVSGSHTSDSIHIGVGAGPTDQGGEIAGGFVGNMGTFLGNGGTTSITNSYATGDVQSDGNFTQLIAGFAGFIGAGATITDSHSTGNVTAGVGWSDTSEVGGFAGQIYKDTGGSVPNIENSYSSGNVTSGDNSARVGGFAGEIVDGTITSDYSTSTINVGADFSNNTNTTMVGGFAGRIGQSLTTSVSVSKCYSTGNSSVLGDGDPVGGFVGQVENASTLISDTYARGNATDTSAGFTDLDLGGYIGWFKGGVIQNSYSTGIPSENLSSSFVGGFLGFHEGGTITSSYWDTETSLLGTSDGGSPLTSSQLKDSSNLTGWDFISTWFIVPALNDGFPQFSSGATPTPTASPTSAPTVPPGENPGTTSPGGGNCSASSPIYAPDLFRIDRNADIATLWFTPVLGPETGYAILYGYYPGDNRFGTAFNQGYSSGALSYKIGSLNPNQIYYFKIQAINNCTGGSWSNYLASAASLNPIKESTPSPSPTLIATISPSPVSMPLTNSNNTVSPTQIPENTGGVSPIVIIQGFISPASATKIIRTATITFTSGLAIVLLVNLLASLLVIFRTLLPIYNLTSRSLFRLPFDFAGSSLQWFFSLFGFFGGDKNKDTAVFNSISNKGVKGAYIIFYSASGNLATSFTDNSGHYSVTPKPDKYQVKVDSTTYNFPSRLVSESSGAVYSHIYHPGEVIDVTGEKPQVAVVSVPIDPADSKSLSKYILAKMNFFLSIFISKLGLIISLLGIAVSVYASIYNPTPLNYAVLVFLVAFFIISVFRNIFAKPAPNVLINNV